MSLTLKVNFPKGWPCPSIVDAVGQPATGNTLFEGAVAHLNSAGQWVLGISTGATGQAQIPYVLWNGAAGDGDNSHFNPPLSSANQFVQVGYGGVQGIALINQIEVETAAYSGTPVFGNYLAADTVTPGNFRVAVTGDVILGIVTKGVHKMSNGVGNANVISFIPDTSKRIVP